MSLLDAHADTLATNATQGYRPAKPPPEPGIFDNFGGSAGNYFMRSMAEAGRAGSMALAAIPVTIDAVTAPDSLLGQAIGDKPLADRYFEFHDEVFGSAVDHWTPRPREVGTAGQVVGQLGGGIVKFLANPALAVADIQMTTSEDLVRKGVGTGKAIAAGAIAGTGMAIGIRAPAAIGGTLPARIASGAGINVAQGAVTSAAQTQVLAGESSEVLQQFDPLDPKSRTIDALLGAVFGAKAHFDATPTQRDALLTMNQARHIESNSLPGRPATTADLTKAVDGTRTAMDQLLRGEPVAVDEPLPRFVDDPEAQAFRTEMQTLVESEAPAVIEPAIARPEMAEPDMPPPPPEPPAGQPKPEAPTAPKFADTVLLPAGGFDPETGAQRLVSANEVIAKAQADAEVAKQSAPNLLQTAASCLLGSL